MKVEARIHYSDGNVRFANVEILGDICTMPSMARLDLWPYTTTVKVWVKLLNSLMHVCVQKGESSPIDREDGK